MTAYAFDLTENWSPRVESHRCRWAAHHSLESDTVDQWRSNFRILRILTVTPLRHVAVLSQEIKRYWRSLGERPNHSVCAAGLVAIMDG